MFDYQNTLKIHPTLNPIQTTSFKSTKKNSHQSPTNQTQASHINPKPKPKPKPKPQTTYKHYNQNGRP